MKATPEDVAKRRSTRRRGVRHVASMKATPEDVAKFAVVTGVPSSVRPQ